MNRLKQKYSTSKLESVFELGMTHKRKNVDGLLEESNAKSHDRLNPEEEFINQDYLTPKTVGMPEFDDNGKRIQGNQQFVLNGQKVDLDDGSLSIPFMFGINGNGDIGNVDGGVNGNQKYVLKQKNINPSVIQNYSQYPIYYHVPDQVIGEVLDKDELVRSQPLQQTLERRYPLLKNNLPFKTYESPATLVNQRGVNANFVERREQLFV